jgi:PleD family two-component response regulator
LLCELLQELDFPLVVPALSLTNAHERMQLVAFEVILAEVDGINDPGFDFVSEVRFGSEDTRRTPIIIVSGDSAFSMVAKARNCGANGFLTRPFSRGSLGLQIAGALSHNRKFITAATYAGPDRRRWSDPNYCGPERRAKAGGEILID